MDKKRDKVTGGGDTRYSQYRGMCGLIYVRFARGFNRMHQKTSQNGQYCQNSYGLNGILQYS